MCLITKQKRPRLSLRRIPIYKILGKSRRTGRYGTPYLCFPVERKKTYKDKEAPMVIMTEYGHRSIGGGFFHAFLSYDYAEVECMVINMRTDRNEWEYVVVSGYIPPFTKYYIGDYKEIAARKIHYN